MWSTQHAQPRVQKARLTKQSSATLKAERQAELRAMPLGAARPRLLSLSSSLTATQLSLLNEAVCCLLQQPSAEPIAVTAEPLPFSDVWDSVALTDAEVEALLKELS